MTYHVEPDGDKFKIVDVNGMTIAWCATSGLAKYLIKLIEIDQAKKKVLWPKGVKSG